MGFKIGPVFALRDPERESVSKTPSMGPKNTANCAVGRGPCSAL